MNPQEILAELDRLQITVWWDESSQHLKHVTTPIIRVPSTAPPELQAAIREHNDELIKLMRRHKGSTPGIYFRRPRSDG